MADAGRWADAAHQDLRIAIRLLPGARVRSLRVVRRPCPGVFSAAIPGYGVTSVKVDSEDAEEPLFRSVAFAVSE
jgi:hypothetical protein